MRNTKPKKTKSLMADKKLTDSIDCVPPKLDYQSICEGGLLAGRIGVQKKTTDVLLHNSRSHGNIDAHSSIRTDECTTQ